MNMSVVIISMVLFFGTISCGMVLFFTRWGKNRIAELAFRKKYVICHLKNENTGFEEIWKVVPPTDKMTLIGKHYYNLDPKYAMMRWKGRLHFQINEKDVIPEYINRTDSKEEILIQVGETDTAINTRAYKIIYGKEKNIALILCAVAFLIAILIAVYAIYKINSFEATMQFVLSKVSVIKVE